MRILVDGNPDINGQCAVCSSEKQPCPRWNAKAIGAERTLPFLLCSVRPHLERGILLWGPQYRKGMDLLGHGRAMTTIPGLK